LTYFADEILKEEREKEANTKYHVARELRERERERERERI
jgi:hypothetical protein